MSEKAEAGPSIPIAAVERDTGLSKDTLRIWERRYGFPQPLRDAQGERAYPADQVDKLRLLKRLLDQGHRPGKLMARDLAELRGLADPPPKAEGVRPTLPPQYAGLLASHDVHGLRQVLQHALMELGVQRFVIEQVAPLNAAVGESWLRGDISVAQEHVYTEAVQLVLRQAIGTMPAPRDDAPRLLLATLPQESHGLGLLMVEAMLSVHGWRCVSLGTRVPMEDIVSTARMIDARIVALGFAGSYSAAQAMAALQELRGLLGPAVQVWAGGSNLALQRRLPAGVVAVRDIAQLPALVAAWEQALIGPAA